MSETSDVPQRFVEAVAAVRRLLDDRREQIAKVRERGEEPDWQHLVELLAMAGALKAFADAQLPDLLRGAWQLVDEFRPIS